jgi:hypothetical protein
MLKDWSRLCRQLDELRASTSVDGAAPIRSKIKEIVPEYSFQASGSKESGSETQTKGRFRAAAGND